MSTWPSHPFLCEISTWVWLRELAWSYQRLVDLAMFPVQEWDAIAPPMAWVEIAVWGLFCA